MTVHNSGFYIHSHEYVYVDYSEQEVVQLLAAGAKILS
jgi:hypothetical protein